MLADFLYHSWPVLGIVPAKISRIVRPMSSALREAMAVAQTHSSASMKRPCSMMVIEKNRDEYPENLRELFFKRRSTSASCNACAVTPDPQGTLFELGAINLHS